MSRSDRQNKPLHPPVVLFVTLSFAIATTMPVRSASASISAVPSEEELARWNNHAEKCSDHKESPDVAIEHCTAAINSRDLVDLVRAIILSNRGFAHLRRGDYDGAIEDASQASRLERSFSFALVVRAAAYAGKADYDRAVQDFNEAIRLDPKNSFAFSGRGHSHQNKQDYDAAIRDYNIAIGLDPGEAEVFSERGYVYALKGEYDRAIVDYDEAIRLDPANGLAFIRRGNAYSRKAQYARSIQDYDEAIRLDPRDARGFRSKGRALFYLGRFEDAQDAFARAVEFDPNDAYGPLWRYLIRQRMGQNEIDELSAYAARVDLQAWPRPIVKLYLGTATTDEVLRAATDADPRKDREQKCEAYFYLGEAALLRGDIDEASRLFNATVATGVRNYVEYQTAEFELQRLKR